MINGLACLPISRQTLDRISSVQFSYRANIEQPAGRTMVINILIRRAGGL